MGDFRGGRRQIGEELLWVARHACGTGCSHTYKSHAPGQCSKARNNILVCRAWHCCQLNPPTRGGGGGGIQKKAKNANQNTQVSNNTDLGVKASNSTAHVREPQNPPQSLQAAEAWDAPSQGARSPARKQCLSTKPAHKLQFCPRNREQTPRLYKVATVLLLTWTTGYW